MGYVHAVAHTLGGQYNIPHGLANAVLMPIVLDEYGESAYQKLHELAVVAGVSKESDDVANSAKHFIQSIRDMHARMGIPTGFSNIEPADIIQLGSFNNQFYHNVFINKIEKQKVFVSAHSIDSYMRPLDSYDFDKLKYIHIVGVRKVV